MAFEKNNTLRKEGKSGIKKGGKHKRTLIKEALADRLADFDEKLYKLTDQLLLDDETQLEAWKHLTKLRVPMKKDIGLEVKTPIVIEVKEYV